MMRLVIGFILAPLLAPLGSWPAEFLTSFAVGDDLRSVNTDRASLIYLAYIMLVFTALPWVLYFKKRGWTSASAIIGLGALIGAAPFLIIGIVYVVGSLVGAIMLLIKHGYTPIVMSDLMREFDFIVSRTPAYLGLSAYFAIVGSVCASAFWLLAVWKNPKITEK